MDAIPFKFCDAVASMVNTGPDAAVLSGAWRSAFQEYTTNIISFRLYVCASNGQWHYNIAIKTEIVQFKDLLSMPRRYLRCSKVILHNYWLPVITWHSSTEERIVKIVEFAKSFMNEPELEANIWSTDTPDDAHTIIEFLQRFRIGEMLDDEQKLMLINFMQKNPCFWDRSDINYLNSATKGLLFAKLANTIGTSAFDKYAEEMEKREREVKSGWKSLKKSYQDEKLRQQQEGRSDDPLFPFYPHMKFLEKSGHRNHPKTMSSIPAFPKNEKEFSSTSTRRNEIFPIEEPNTSPQQLSIELGDDFSFSGAESGAHSLNDNGKRFTPFDLKVQPPVNDVQFPRYNNPNQSTIIGGRADRFRKRRLQEELKNVMPASATATAGNVRRLKLIRPPAGGGSPVNSPMPTLTPNTTRSITPTATSTSKSSTTSASISASKAAFLAYVERLYNSIDDPEKVAFEEDVIRFAFDWKKRKEA
ncbi:hypothetical protein QR680_003814 [Steinernema hermaphroditum]|uniref:MADF domain-containing protein n=1 Tax=Steinernema hermaphroditum TaxID=289476 RepID=A0AA39HNW2_9BILA|nr:hypothetical protein QR680_003814 [Steinernema hermaphroditum]